MKPECRRSGGIWGVVASVAVAAGLGGTACVPEGEAGPTGHATEAVTAFAGVLTQHNDLARTGANLSETILTPARVQAGFGKLTSLVVGGQVQAQPLYAPAAVMGQDAVIIATEQNRVYAFKADPPWTMFWQANLEAATFTPPSPGCGNSQ